MFEKFRDYLYYLLPTPFKRLKKEMNQWYIFMGVIGDMYDEAQKDLSRALDETAVATCSDILLQYYAQDKGMYQYPGEDNETFRARIAMHDEVEALGGTKEGILLAARTLGYKDAEHKWLPDLGYPDKWSQFLLVLTIDADAEHPVSFPVLRDEVRKVKDSTSLDNYCLRNTITGTIYPGAAIAVKNKVRIGDVGT